MLDLGTTFLAAVERSPERVAVVDGGLRLTYAWWLETIRAVAGGLAGLGLARGDRAGQAIGGLKLGTVPRPR